MIFGIRNSDIRKRFLSRIFEQSLQTKGVESILCWFNTVLIQKLRRKTLLDVLVPFLQFDYNWPENFQIKINQMNEHSNFLLINSNGSFCIQL